MNGGRLHAGPLRGRHQVILVHAVLQAVRDTAFRREDRHKQDTLRICVFENLVETTETTIMSEMCYQLTYDRKITFSQNIFIGTDVK